ncbi:MAG: peptide deformylase [Actinomycetota bacterium]
MGVRKVLTYPHPCLREHASEVTEFDGSVLELAEDLVDTMRAHNRCVGLAAPQIGEAVRMIAVDVSEHPKTTGSHGLIVLVNPIVTLSAGAEVGREGCLSLPDITANVRRSIRIRFEAALPDGRGFKSMTAGFEARALLHEIDHLDGILILDRVASPAEVFARRQP